MRGQLNDPGTHCVSPEAGKRVSPVPYLGNSCALWWWQHEPAGSHLSLDTNIFPGRLSLAH